MSHLPHDAELAGRRALMALCAEATRAELDAVLAGTAYAEGVEDLRRPEIGLVMVRGRIGGEGSAFNLGEATVARAAVRLATGQTGFAYLLGRDAAKARLAAVLDALWQSESHREAVETGAAPIRERLAAEDETSRRRSAATRVNFFTMVRGEDS